MICVIHKNQAFKNMKKLLHIIRFSLKVSFHKKKNAK